MMHSGLLSCHHMHTPTIDIIVPVWNNPFETRACLAAILEYSPQARLIIVANGSNRETELMLEEFSEPLGERALFLLSDKHLGLVPALNRGLSRSDSDYTVIVRPNVMVNPGWLERLVHAAEAPEAGIVTPLFYGTGAPGTTSPVAGCSLIETDSISFTTLLLKGEMRMLIGNFDEELDGGVWCLFDYMRRAQTRGYRTYCTDRVRLQCNRNESFGSLMRRQTLTEQSKTACLGRWGIQRHLCIYCGKDAKTDELCGLVEHLLQTARHGEHCTLILHRKQFRESIRRGWNGLHTGLMLRNLPIFGAERQLTNIFTAQKSTCEETIAVRGVKSTAFPGITDAPYWEEIL